jgi:copper chaperone CopZ
MTEVQSLSKPLGEEGVATPAAAARREASPCACPCGAWAAPPSLHACTALTPPTSPPPPSPQPIPAAAAPEQPPETVVLDVGGMKCGGCSAAVKRVLLQQDGVAAAAVNLLTETAAVQVAGGGAAAALGARAAEMLTAKVGAFWCSRGWGARIAPASRPLVSPPVARAPPHTCTNRPSILA